MPESLVNWDIPPPIDSRPGDGLKSSVRIALVLGTALLWITGLMAGGLEVGGDCFAPDAVCEVAWKAASQRFDMLIATVLALTAAAGLAAIRVNVLTMIPLLVLTLSAGWFATFGVAARDHISPAAPVFLFLVTPALLVYVAACAMVIVRAARFSGWSR